MVNVLICGYGNIGTHLEKELKPYSNKIKLFIYDKYYEEQFIEDKYNGLFKNKDVYCTKEDLKALKNIKFDFTFICVPTEMKEDGSANTDEVINCLETFCENTDTFVIKSAIPVGFAESTQYQNIVVSPEFWGTTQHSKDPNFLILGGHRIYTDKVANLYTLIKDGYYKYYFTDHKMAELVKYMENCWIATKVTFCNEFAKIANSFGISYPELRELWLADTRVSPSHTYVYPDKPYFDSHCLNKDIPALIAMCKGKVDTPLMQSVLDIKTKSSNNNM